MKLDITSLLSGRKKSLGFSYKLDPLSPEYPLPPTGIALSGEIDVDISVARTGSFLKLCLTARLPYGALCDRCAAEINGTAEIALERLILGSEDVYDSDGGSADSGYIVPENGIVDIDDEIVEELMLSFPPQLLCSPDCRGICPICGQNKNEGDCACCDTVETDPRWEKLLSLLEKDPEK